MTDVYAIKNIEKDKIECNNVNMNLNGLDFDAIQEPLSSLLQSQAEGEAAGIGTSNFNGKDFSFVV